jgi:regulator of sigma E protease
VGTEPLALVEGNLMTDFFLHSFNTLGNGLIGYIIPFLFVLTIVVFFHELGHFLVARWNGVKVLTFSLGFGPELAGFNDRHGTRWKISAIPLGGYVKFFGDESEASTPASSETLASMTAEERAGSFHHKKVGARAAIVAAGPIANFILAIVIFTCLFTFFGKPSTTARVDKIEANSAASKAGFQVGDIVTAIDGKTIGSFSDMQRVVGVRAGDTLNFTIKRGDSTLQLKGTPELREVKDSFGNVHRLGVLGITRATAPGDVVTERVDPASALWLGVKETWFVVDRTLAYIGGVFTGREAADQVGGPIRIAQISGQVATIGLAALVHLAAVLSISIGLLNLFPVPLLDGGHLLFYAVEAVRGRPLSERAQEMGFRIGLGLVLMLMVFATYNDILHLAAS